MTYNQEKNKCRETIETDIPAASSFPLVAKYKVHDPILTRERTPESK